MPNRLQINHWKLVFLRVSLWGVDLVLIETLYRENISFRDRDLKRFKRCHMASENFDAELLLNIRVSI